MPFPQLSNAAQGSKALKLPHPPAHARAAAGMLEGWQTPSLSLPQIEHAYLQGQRAAPGLVDPHTPILAYSGQLLSVRTPGQAKDLGTDEGIRGASPFIPGPPPLQLSNLVLMALQLQPLSSSLKVPDANGQVIGTGSQYISSQRVEAQRVNLFCVAWRTQEVMQCPWEAIAPTGSSLSGPSNL